MPNTQNHAQRDYSEYDLMSDEELEKLLRDDFSKPEGEESDLEMLLYIMEVLAKRRNERNEGKTPAEAWESFKQNYYTENDSCCISESVSVSQSRNCGNRKWRLLATAAMLVLVIGTAAAAKALEGDLLRPIAKWTQDTFYFASPGQTNVNNETSSSDIRNNTGLQEALDKYNVSLALAPTWIPDGYEQVDVKTIHTSAKRIFFAQYMNNDKTLHIRISTYLESDPTQMQQGGGLIELYTANGIDYYIFRNYDRLKAAWINGDYECVISGPISLSEMKKMIDSIGKG